METQLPPAPISAPAPPMPDVPPVAPAAPAPTTFETGGEMSSASKINWMALGIMSLAVASMLYQVIYYRKQIDAVSAAKGSGSASNAQIVRNLKEVKMNVKKALGNKYVEIAS